MKNKRESPIKILSFIWLVSEEELKTWEIKKKLISFFNEYASKYCFQLERGILKKRLHYQGYFKGQIRRRFNNWKEFFNEKLKGIMLKVCSTNGRQELKNYSMKKDTHIEGPWADRAIYSGWAHKYPIRGAWIKLTEYLVNKKNRRNIIVIHDGKGGIGKSYWMEYMGRKHRAFVSNLGTPRDIAYEIVNSKSNLEIFIFNIPRGEINLYRIREFCSFVEKIKDGRIKSEKYESVSIKIDPPQVVILTNNALPKGSFSEDRIWHFPIKNNPICKEAAEEIRKERSDLDAIL